MITIVGRQHPAVAIEKHLVFGRIDQPPLVDTLEQCLGLWPTMFHKAGSRRENSARVGMMSQLYQRLLANSSNRISRCGILGLTSRLYVVPGCMIYLCFAWGARRPRRKNRTLVPRHLDNVQHCNSLGYTAIMRCTLNRLAASRPRQSKGKSCNQALHTISRSIPKSRN